MTQTTGAIIVFGVIVALVLMMLYLERRGVAQRRAARGGREVDLGEIFTPDGPLKQKDAREGRI
ncbi:MAG: hypothetical protein AAGG57_17450 [Pseudomonadota bacterium]